MPISKSGSTINETEAAQLKRSLSTDVHPTDDFAICDAKDPLKQIQFACSGLTTNTTATITAQASGTFTLPAAGGTLSGQNKVLQYAAPTTGATVVVAAGTEHLVLNPAGDIAELTITLPTTPADGTIVRVSTTQAVTDALTIDDGAASTVGAPATLTDNSFFALIYRATGTTWYRAG